MKIRIGIFKTIRDCGKDGWIGWYKVKGKWA